MLRRQEMHGYQLYEYIDQALAACTDLKKPTAYYLLAKMAEDGWITEEVGQEGNRPPRKVYRLTAQGEAEYQRRLRENLSAYQPVSFAGDIGLAFLDGIAPDEALELLSQRRAALAEALDQLMAAPEHRGSLQLAIEHQRRHLAGELAWLDMVMEHVRGGGQALQRPLAEARDGQSRE
jgi:DNA-binding PadR family transcriptional regulator